MNVKRRDLLASAPSAALLGLLGACVTRSDPGVADTDDLYRVDDPSIIMAAARAIVDEDYVGVLVTIDGEGMPRARPIGAALPGDDWDLWLSTRRGSRKTRQIEANPKAALHFGFDDIANNHADSFYASFTGYASVHTDAASIAAFGPVESYRANWPDYPNDLAIIRFQPRRLEVMGRGISSNEAYWQPQGIFLP